MQLHEAFEPPALAYLQSNANTNTFTSLLKGLQTYQNDIAARMAQGLNQDAYLKAQGEYAMINHILELFTPPR